MNIFWKQRNTRGVPFEKPVTGVGAVKDTPWRKLIVEKESGTDKPLGGLPACCTSLPSPLPPPDPQEVTH